jgi:hypothetical protein
MEGESPSTSFHWRENLRACPLLGGKICENVLSLEGKSASWSFIILFCTEQSLHQNFRLIVNWLRVYLILNYVLWRNSLNVYLIIVVFYCDASKTITTVCHCTWQKSTKTESKLGQISLGLNQSCSNRLRVQIIPHLRSTDIVLQSLHLATHRMYSVHITIAVWLWASFKNPLERLCDNNLLSRHIFSRQVSVCSG